MAEWVLAVERAYVAAATNRHPPRANTGDFAHARAAVGAIASRYLAVGTPRTLGLIADASTIQEAALSVVAHQTWFKPREIRCTDPELAKGTNGVVASIGEALASDIVCVHTMMEVRASQLRRGTHVNVFAGGIDDELAALATVCDETLLGSLAAGLVDGRQLDELTVFAASDLAVALGALHS